MTSEQIIADIMTDAFPLELISGSSVLEVAQSILQALRDTNMIREWKPIVAAPKDTTPFLAYDAAWDERGMAILRWDENTG